MVSCSGSKSKRRSGAPCGIVLDEQLASGIQMAEEQTDLYSTVKYYTYECKLSVAAAICLVYIFVEFSIQSD